MRSATKIMKEEISNINFLVPKNNIVSNVNAQPISDPLEIKKLLIQQIEKPVRWRESIENIIKTGNKKFIEIGPGKVLSGIIKRIDRDVKIIQVSSIKDLNNLEDM